MTGNIRIDKLIIEAVADGGRVKIIRHSTGTNPSSYWTPRRLAGAKEVETIIRTNVMVSTNRETPQLLAKGFKQGDEPIEWKETPMFGRLPEVNKHGVELVMSHEDIVAKLNKAKSLLDT